MVENLGVFGGVEVFNDLFFEFGFDCLNVKNVIKIDTRQVLLLLEGLMEFEDIAKTHKNP